MNQNSGSELQRLAAAQAAFDKDIHEAAENMIRAETYKLIKTETMTKTKFVPVYWSWASFVIGYALCALVMTVFR